MTGRFDHLWAPRGFEAPRLDVLDDPHGSTGSTSAAAHAGPAPDASTPPDRAVPEAGSAAPSAGGAPPSPDRPFDLVLSTGERLPLDRPTVVGREPRVEPGVRGVRVAPSLLDLSRSHLSLEPAPAGALVRDLGSANGSALVRNGARTSLRPYEPVEVGPADAIVLADAMEIRLVASAGAGARMSATASMPAAPARPGAST